MTPSSELSSCVMIWMEEGLIRSQGKSHGLHMLWNFDLSIETDLGHLTSGVVLYKLTERS